VELVLASLFAEGAISEIGGVVTEAGVDFIRSEIGERLRRSRRPENLELRAAVGAAYALSVREVGIASLKELGVAPAKLRRGLRDRFSPPDGVEALDDLLRRVRRRLKDLESPAGPIAELEASPELLLGPAGDASQVRGRLVEAMLADVRSWGGEPPEVFERLARSGWAEPGSGDGGRRLDWFMVLSAFFVDELKHNTAARDVFATEILARVPGVSASIADLERRWTEWAGPAAELLDRLDESVRQLAADQSEAFASLRRALLETQRSADSDAGAMRSEVAGVAAAVDELRAVILRESSTPAAGGDGREGALEAARETVSLSTRAAGRQAGEEVDRLVASHQAGVFVGREDSLADIATFLAGPPGRLVVTAEAGFGKTALLARAMLVPPLADHFVAYHFFGAGPIARRAADAYANVLRQLFVYYAVEGEEIPDDPARLRQLIWALVVDRRAPFGPLTIVLDGIDDAESELLWPFPDPLPDGVHIVVAARAGAGPAPGYLSQWVPDDDRSGSAERLHLTRVSRGQIIDWLRTAGDGALAAQADDPLFVDRVDEVTAGYPMHLRYLMEDLVDAVREGRDASALLEAMPSGFVRFVRASLRQLDEIDLVDEGWMAFAVLTVAKGPLPEDELKDLTSLRDRQIRRLRDLRAVSRWLSVSGNGDGTTWAFAQPALGVAFKEILGDDADEALDLLLAHCADWRSNRGPYAVRHYPAHLLDGISDQGEDDPPPTEREEIYALARDEEFLEAQRERWPDDLELPLRTMQTAIRAAALTDDAAAMAEFVLAHAAELSRLRAGLRPSEAVDRGDLELALRGADVLGTERSAVWSLVIAWQLALDGRADDGREIASRLVRRSLPALEGRLETTAQVVLAGLSVTPLSIGALPGLLLSERGRVELAVRAASRAPEAALVALQRVSPGPDRGAALATIAEALVERADLDGADAAAGAALRDLDDADDVAALQCGIRAAARSRLFGDAVRLASRLPGRSALAVAAAAIARAAAPFNRDLASDLVESASVACEEIGRAEEWDYYASVGYEFDAAATPEGPAPRGVVARMLAQSSWAAGWISANGTPQSIEAATRALSSIDDPVESATALAGLGGVLAKVGGDPAAATSVFELAWEGAAATEDAGVLGELRLAVVLVEADVGLTTQAAAAAGTIEDPRWRAEALVAVAELAPDDEVGLVAEVLADARHELDGVDDSETAAWLLLRAALRLRACGLVEEARAARRAVTDLARGIEGALARTKLLKVLALEFAEAEDAQAERLFAEALESAKSIEEPAARSSLLQTLSAAAPAAAGGSQDAPEPTPLDPLQRVGLVAHQAYSQGLGDIADFDSVLEAVATLDDTLGHAALVYLARNLAGAGKVGLARRAVDAAADTEGRVATLVATAQGAIAARELDAADEIQAQAWVEAASLDEPGSATGAVTPLADLWVDLLESRATARFGDWRLEPSAADPPPESSVGILNGLFATDVADSEARRSAGAGARAHANTIEDPLERASFLAMVVAGQADARLGDEVAATASLAFEACMAVAEDPLRLEAGLAIASAAAWSGGPDDESVAAALDAVALSLAEPRRRAEFLLMLAVTGWTGDPAAVLARALEAAVAVEASEERVRTLAGIVRALVRRGVSAEAAIGQFGAACDELADPIRQRAARGALEDLLTYTPPPRLAASRDEVGRGVWAALRARVRADVAEACWPIDPERGTKMLDDAVKDAASAEGALKVEACARVAVGMARCARGEDARRLLGDVVQDVQTAADAAKLSGAALEAGAEELAASMAERAFELAAAVDEEPLRAGAGESAIVASRALDHKVASERLETLLVSIGSVERRTDLRLAFATAMLDAGNDAAALESVLAVLRPSDVDHDARKAWALASVARAQAAIGSFDGAARTARAIPDPHAADALLEDIESARARPAPRAAAGVPVEAAAPPADPQLEQPDQALRGVDLIAANAVDDEAKRRKLLVAAAKREADAKRGARAVHAVEYILSGKGRALVEVAGALARVGARTDFERLLLPAAYHRDASLEVCDLLVVLYPRQADAVADVVRAAV
jgi:hypothetical protein